MKNMPKEEKEELRKQSRCQETCKVRYLGINMTKKPKYINKGQLYGSNERNQSTFAEMV